MPPSMNACCFEISGNILQRRVSAHFLSFSFDPLCLSTGGSRLGIAIAAARELGMLGGGYTDEDIAGAGSSSLGAEGSASHVSMANDLRRVSLGSEEFTPLQSPGGVGDDDMFANFV